MAIDSNTLLLLSFDGTGGEVTTIDSGVNSHGPISNVGSVQQDDSQFKFLTGSSSQHDGSSDYWSIPNHTDWDFLTSNNQPFTIDLWVRFDSVAANRGFIGQDNGTSHAWGLYWNTSNTLTFEGKKSFQNQSWTASWIPTINTWYHIACVRDSADNRYLFINGVSLTLSAEQKSSAWSVGAGQPLTIGYIDVAGAKHHSGWIDELRVSDVARWTANFTPEVIPYGPVYIPPIEVVTIDKYFVNPHNVKRQKSPTNPGDFTTAGLEIPVPIKMDKWQNLSQPPARRKKTNPASTTQVVFVDFTVPTLPEVLISQWQGTQYPRKLKPLIKLHSSFASSEIEAINPVNGNYFDSGVFGFAITTEHTESQSFKDSGFIGITITAEHVEDFQLEDTGVISFSIKYPDIGVESFNSGVPGFVAANVIIDNINESNYIHGMVSVTREDNAAARFNLQLDQDQSIPLLKKPIEFINKTISISFAAADMDGIVLDYIPIFVGIIKGVQFNEDQKLLRLSGYDYNGIHQTRGEYISDNITSVLTGSIGAGSAGTLITGHNPIWGVVWVGSSAVKDGEDYFIDTQNGQIVIPVSSRILQFPGHFNYNYADHFDSMRDIIQAIASQKNWVIEEDEVVIADYTATAAHPVLSLSDESVIDTCGKFLELSGAKLEGNLYPKLRVYSEVENWINPINTLIVDEDVIFANTLTYNIDFEDLLNEQTTRSVQRVNANIAIGASEPIAEFTADAPSTNPFTVQGDVVYAWGLDLSTPAVLATHRISKQGLNSISLSSSGRFHLFHTFEQFEETIDSNSWNMFVDGDDYVLQLSHTVVVIGGGGVLLYAYPAFEYTLTVNGSKISYGGGSPEDVRVVTSQRPITGITETLKGDVYENPYIETDTHCVNINNAVLLEYGNPYTAQFEIPVFVGRNAQIGNRVDIQRSNSTIFSGIIKTLNYQMDLADGNNKIVVGAKGIGKGM